MKAVFMAITKILVGFTQAISHSFETSGDGRDARCNRPAGLPFPEVKRMLFAAAVRNGNRVSDDQSY